MGVEAATFVSDLQAANPGSSDLRNQGDDHLRLIKQVVQNTLPNASKAFYFPTTQSKTADFAVVAADMQKTFLVDTTAAIVNMTLPTLVAGDAGWECYLIKTNTGVNPVLVKPPSGTLTSGAIAGLSAARRCIPGAKITCLWTGSTFIIGRAPSVGGPVGAAIELQVATLPVGYEWPSGQTLASAATNYPEYNSVKGSGLTLDKRGRTSIVLDNLGGSSAGRLPGGIITGTAVGNTGGIDTVTLGLATIPTGITSSGVNLITVTSTVGNIELDNGDFVVNQGTGATVPQTSLGFVTSQGNNNIGVTSNNTSGGAHSNIQPSIMVAQVLIVE